MVICIILGVCIVFYFVFCFIVVDLIFLFMWGFIVCEGIIGNMVFGFFLNKSLCGVWFVVICGVYWYCLRNLNIFCF